MSAPEVRPGPTAEPPRAVMSARRVSLLGAMLVAIGPISMAIYTPAMTEIVHAFAATEAQVKMTLTLFFGGFAIAQLFAGPLSDALGRRPITFAFMAIYCVASLGALIAPSVEVLMAARFLQGVGASAGIAISRAIVRDQFRGEQSSRIMNLIGIMLAAGPAFAPTIGGLMLMAAGWRSIFVLMAAVGLTVALVTALCLRETVIADRSRLSVRALGAAYGELLGSRQFLSASGVIAGSIGALYAQSTFLPFILIDRVGLSPAAFGLGMVLQTGSFFFGSLVTRALMDRIGAERLVGPGLACIAAGGSGAALVLVWEPTFLHVMGPVGLSAFGIALMMPAITTGALAPFPHIAGAAAALMGFMQMGAGLLGGSLGALLGDPVRAFGLVVPAMGLIACLAHASYRRRRAAGRPVRRGDARRARCDLIEAPTPAE